MRVGLLLAALALGLFGATPPQQRSQRTCRVQVDSVGRAANFVKLADGTEQIFAGGGVLARCIGEATTMTSDSMAYFQAQAELRFLGNVHFRDSTSLLDADRVTYWTREERLHAEGNVYTRNLTSGSEMRGPNLDYYRAVPGVRDTVQLYATARPTIHFFSARDSGRADRRPFVIVSDRVAMRHNDRMWGSGRVTIDRDDLNARSDSAFLNLADSLGYLIGVAEVIGRDTAAPADSNTYRLTGQRIRFELTGGQEVRRAVAVHRALATGPDWTLHGDTLDIALDSSRVQRAQAWGRMDDEQPSAQSGLSTVLGDSLDVQMPGQVMHLVWAYGRARASSRPDTTVVEEDWLAGDTLRADFASARDAAGRRRSEVEHVTAVGGDRVPLASAYYHTENESEPAGPRGISYSRGQRIRIAMRERRVRTVDVVGAVDGVYLEPLPRAVRDSLAAAADSSRADSTRADSAAGPRRAPATADTARAPRPPLRSPRAQRPAT